MATERDRMLAGAIPDGIDPASVDFVKQHKAELATLFDSPKAG